jgi:hypothetical protein
MNLNKLAVMVARNEGLKQQLSIAQIKEVMRILFTILASEEPKEVELVLKRYR